MMFIPPDFEAIRREKLKEIAIALLPSLIERAPMPLNHEQIVAQAYKFAKEVVSQGALKKEH